MKTKYYLKIEIRYSIPRNEDLDEYEYQQTYFSKLIHSDLFDSQKECIDYGNKLIANNRWMEQYPGYMGLNLTSKFNLVAPSLKNGSQIFIKVERLDIFDFDEANTEILKFNINKITNKL